MNRLPAFPITPELEPIVLRLAHVDQQIERMIVLSVEWSQSDPVTIEIHRTGDTDRAIVTSVRTVPPSICLLFSDAIQQLRACLDNMVWNLATSRSKPPPEKIAKRIAFPIYEEQAEWIKWTKARARDGIAALAPGATAAERVRALQPFSDRASTVPERETPILDRLVGGRVERAHALALLQRYSNHDKHRALAVSVVHGYQSRLDIPLAEQELVFERVQEGSAFVTIPAGTVVPMEGNTGFAIQRPGSLAGTPMVISELRRLYDYVRNTAVPFLATGLVVEAPFPSGVDLGDSTQSVKARIGEGSWRTADERFRASLPSMMNEALARPPGRPKLVIHAPTDECAPCSRPPSEQS